MLGCGCADVFERWRTTVVGALACAVGAPCGRTDRGAPGQGAQAQGGDALNFGLIPSTEVNPIERLWKAMREDCHGNHFMAAFYAFESSAADAAAGFMASTWCECWLPVRRRVARHRHFRG